MQTRCPECDTLFDLTEEELHQAQGMVVCGQCDSVFNASRYLSLEDTDLPTISTVKDDGDTAPDDELDELANIPRALRDDLISVQARKHPKLLNALLGFMIFGLVVGLLAQTFYFHRSYLAQYAVLRPYLEQLCEPLNCRVPKLRNPTAIELVSRNIYTHPNIDKALMITATLANNADYPQAFPTIGLQLSNLQGKVIASRYFKPDEYLGQNAADLEMQPSTPTNISLEIADPGERVLSYEFSFL